MKNTLTKGAVRTITFKEGGTWYGVALEFNIVESGDDPREVMLYLDEAIRGYLESAQKSKLSVGVVNQKTDSEYEKLWTSVQEQKKIKSPIQIYQAGYTNLSSLKNHATRS